jgi:hypothetical protein
MGLDAYTLGERDFALGVGRLRQLAARADFPMLAANLVDGDGKAAFGTSVIEKLGSLRVGIIGLLGQRASVPADLLEAAGLRLLPPADVAATEAERLRKQGANLIVVLSHLGRGEEQLVARAAPQIQFFIGGHTGVTRTTKVAREEGASPAFSVEAGSRGKYVGRLEIYPTADGDMSRMADAGLRQALEDGLVKRQRNLARKREFLAQLNAHTPVAGQEAEHKSRVESMQRSIDRIEKQIAAERSKLSAPPPSYAGRAAFVSHIDPIELSIPERQDIREAVASLQATEALAPKSGLPPLARQPKTTQPKKK